MDFQAGAVVTDTTGTDNVPGATRSGSYNGATFHETLIQYSMLPDALIFSYYGKGFTDTLPPAYGSSVHVDGYVETKRFESICDGKATYIDVLTYDCGGGSEQIETYNGWYTVHLSAFGSMAASFGATVMAGDCPCG
jgi:hypothetical protein